MLLPDERPTLRDLFLAATKLADEEQQQAFLNRCCPDRSQREQVERLLSARSERAFSLLEVAVTESQEWHSRHGHAVSLLETGDERQIPQARSTLLGRKNINDQDVTAGGRVGPYEIVEQIGQGGMGTVYLAEQVQPIRREVALKIIKPGMDSQDVISRFEAERQALALMDHPHIARVLDAGRTSTGRPYFVMELVKGAPITQYCAKTRQSLRDRLGLFVRVCQGVRHAHQKGVIHRDLKPTNVLVAEHDGVAVPKVIDFGVAKALDQRLTEQTVLTRVQEMIGTPAYMSPEQAAMDGLDADTRTDVYSLGVVLYELVTGTTPFDTSSLTSQSFDEMRRIIREDLPQRPSQRLSLRAAEAQSVSDRVSSPLPERVWKSRQRELDWIVMKALEKDRTRRYESVSDLSADIQRYLDGEPVEACPPSMTYRLQKFASKSKGWLTAASLIAVLLVVATIISARLAIRATDAEDLAQQAVEDLREQLYASDVVLAAQDLRSNDVEHARTRLTRHIPQLGQKDLRGFEWHYLWKKQRLDGNVVADTSAAVYDLEISPDGDRLAAVGADAMIRVFDLARDELQFTIATGQGETNGVAFSPDGRRLAAAGDDGTVRIWDLTTHSQLVRIPAHEGLAFQVGFSPDGTILASCGKDDTVRLWNAADGRSHGSLNVHAENLETLAVSPEGVVAAGDRESQVSLWSLQKRMPVRENLESGSVYGYDPVTGVAFSENGYLAHGTVEGQLTITDTDRQTVAYRRRLANGIQSLDFSPDGLWLAVGDRAGDLQIVPFEHGVWNLEATRQWSGHEGRVYCVSVTPGGQRILSGGADGRILSWDMSTDTSERRIAFDKKCYSLATIDADQFAVGTDDAVFLCDSDGWNRPTFGKPGGRLRVDYAADASVIFARSETALAAWEFPQRTEVLRWATKGDQRIDNLAVVPDGRTIALCVRDSSGDRELQIVDVRSETVVARWPLRSAGWIEVSADGRWLAYESNHRIELVDLKRTKVRKSWTAHTGAIRGLEFFRSGRSLASVSADRTIKVWSIPDGELTASTLAHRSSAARLAITSDGRRIATGGDDRMLRMWDGDSLQLLWEHPLQFGQIWDLSFSADDRKLFCLCGEQHVVILDGSPIPDPHYRHETSEVESSEPNSGTSQLP